MNRVLTVWWDGAEVGALGLNDHGDMTFVYAATWLEAPDARPLSLSLPLRPEPFDRAGTRPFFAGLLPEEKPRESVARTLGVSRQNDFGLLEHLGGDVAGAISLWPEGERVPVPDAARAARPVENAELADILDRLPRRPLLAGEAGIRLSLAGAQPKLPVVVVGDAIALPAPGQPTTHIIKPAPKEYPTFPENEVLCMRLAGELGLDVARVSLRRADPHLFLLVERYDRMPTENGLRRIHQEDFCQALGITPEHKYAAERGPNFRSSFALLRAATLLPAPAVLALADAALFNVIIGNADAHGKNFSLLRADDGVRLAPLYDLLSTSFYPEVHANMAMRMGGVSRLEEFTFETLGGFAAQVGIGAPYLRRRAAELATRTGDAITRAVEGLGGEGFDSETLRAVADHVLDRSRRFLTAIRQKSGT